MGRDGIHVKQTPCPERQLSLAAGGNGESIGNHGERIWVSAALKQKEWLMNVFLDGRLELSNNRAERAVRPFAVGRKNWLFSNTPRGAKASVAAYSIVETAKANGLRPFKYFQFALEQLPALGWGGAKPVQIIEQMLINT